jgi:hypothetical protein
MVQRSLHVITNVYYRSMSCFAMNSLSKALLVVLWIPHERPLLHRVGKVYHKVGHKVWWHSHSIEQDILPIVFLISKQVVPYRTCDGTCYPGVPTPKIQSLADSSTTCHDGINHLYHSIHCSNHIIDPHTRSSHISTDGRPQHFDKDTSQTKYHKGW